MKNEKQQNKIKHPKAVIKIELYKIRFFEKFSKKCCRSAAYVNITFGGVCLVLLSNGILQIII